MTSLNCLPVPPCWPPAFGSTRAENGGNDVSDVKKITEAERKAATEELNDCLKRGRGGDASTLPFLKELMQKVPSLADTFGNLAEQAELSFIRATAGDDLVFREAL